uniref:Uncharacterized protein LOC100187094 n=1 Tax=Phallusia mammillata TaxID=59560 RepID=A0A6F9DIT1_9ASCI|nr:uncharacterized protein LOC100187094 [Phallusia mammillata]
MGSFNSLEENTILIGQLQQSATGFLQICDGACYIPCIVLPDSDSVVNDTRRDDQFPVKFNIPNTEQLDSLLRLHKFSIVVERRWVETFFDVGCDDMDDWNPNSPENQFLYSLCFVMSVKENTILKTSRKSETTQSMDTPSTSGSQNSLGFEPPTNVDFLLFITHKSQLQEVNSCLFFNVVAFNFQSGNLLDNHLKLSGEACALYSLVYPGTLLLLELGKSDTEELLPKCIESCHLRQIRNTVDLPPHYNHVKVVSFCESAYVKFNSSYFGQGLHKIYSIEQLLTNPPTLARNNLVSLHGVITFRILYKDRLLDTTQDYSTRLDLVDNKSLFSQKLALYIGPNCSASRELGLIPDTTVTFYRVKLIVSQKGQIYCKFTPTSFYIIESLKTKPDSTTPILISPKTEDFSHNDSETLMSVDKEEVSDVTCLYDIYCKTDLNLEDKLIKLKAQVTRLLSVQLTVVCSACGRQRALSCGCPLFSKTGVEPVQSCGNLSGYEVNLEAKTIITDGTGRAVLIFGRHNHSHLCKLLGILSQEWDDVIKLLRHSSSGIISYDCDFYDHRNLLTKPILPRTEAQEVATALFDDINTRCFFPREIVARKQVNVKYQNFRGENGYEAAQAAEMIASRFKLGTVPAECAEDIPQRTLSLRLIKFNCVIVT